MKTYSIWMLASVALAFSCASPGPTEYHRGTPAAPAPVTRPGVGAPVRGQPGQEPNPYPRSPHGRVLPEDEHTRGEPGFWSAQEPHASTEKGPKPSKLYPPDPEFAEVEAGNKCVERYSDAVGKVNKEDGSVDRLTKTLTPEQFECFFVRLYARCVNQLYAEREAVREEILNAPNSSGIAPFSFKRLRDNIDAIKQKVCKGNLPWGTEQVLGRVRQYMGNPTSSGNPG